jgi:hypothetical protein
MRSKYKNGPLRNRFGFGRISKVNKNIFYDKRFRLAKAK